MSPPRPLRIVFGLLAFAGVTKLALATGDYMQPGLTLTGTQGAPSFFVTTASADTENAADEGLDADQGLPLGCALQQGETPDEFFAAITSERALLDAQRLALAQRAAEIDLANEMLTIETARLDELKQEVETLLERASLAHVADVERLVALYSNMKPRDAAAIMNDLDLEVMVTVLGTMTERNAAPILAALNPVRARALSLILLERAKFPGDRRLDRIRLD